MRGYASSRLQERLDVVRGWASAAGEKDFSTVLDRVTFVESDTSAERGGRKLYASAGAGNMVTLYKDFWGLSAADRYAVLVHEVAHLTNENTSVASKASAWDSQFRTTRGLDVERNANDIAMRILRVGPRVNEMPSILRGAQE
jgi:hypothetical protein